MNTNTYRYYDVIILCVIMCILIILCTSYEGIIFRKLFKLYSFKCNQVLTDV